MGGVDRPLKALGKQYRIKYDFNSRHAIPEAADFQRFTIDTYMYVAILNALSNTCTYECVQVT